MRGKGGSLPSSRTSACESGKLANVVKKSPKKWIKYYLVGGIVGVLLVLLGVELQDNYRKYGNFRTMQDPIKLSDSVDLTGLRELSFTGGPLTPLPELKKRFAHVKTKVILVDGVHGKYGYVHGVPDNYLGYSDEQPSLRSYFWRLLYTGSLKAQPSLVVPGAEAAKAYDFDYRNFHIGSKYLSRDKSIDEFVAFFDKLPPDVCLYFHCIHGKGRTSMMLVMADIIMNAPNVALKDIIKRQYLLGSVDLSDTTSWFRSTYNTKALEDRKQFIEDFYAFMCQRQGNGIKLWSEWQQRRKNI